MTTKPLSIVTAHSIQERKSYPVTITPQRSNGNELTGWNGSILSLLMPLVRVSLNGVMATLNARIEKASLSRAGTAQGKWLPSSDTWSPISIIWSPRLEKSTVSGPITALG